MVSKGSVHGQLAIRQKYQNERGGWRKVAQIMAFRKQRAGEQAE